MYRPIGGCSQTGDGCGLVSGEGADINLRDISENISKEVGLGGGLRLDAIR